MPAVTLTKLSRATVPAHVTRTYPPGHVCLEAEAGDVVLVRHAGFVAAGIRAFERLRVPKLFCWTNHACVVLNSGPNAQVVQETAKGAVVTPLAALGAITYTVTHFDEATPEQLAAGLAFLSATVGSGYGYLSILADGFNALTGLELDLGLGDHMVCSTQTTRYMERLGLIPDRNPFSVMPAHLAWYLEVPDPDPER